MGLFGLGKKKEEPKKGPDSQFKKMSSSAPNLPQFPDIPKYESTVADIKKEVGKEGADDLDIPMRKPSFEGKSMASTEISKPISESFDASPSPRRVSFSEERPLFVRIDNYKEAMHTLDALKAKLSDAEELLAALEEVKAQEEQKLDDWKKDIQNIKDKLVSIDKELFEV